MSRLCWALLPAAALLPTAVCNDDSERLAALVADYALADSDVWLALRACPVELGHMTTNDCEAGYDPIDGWEQQCTVDVFEEQVGAGDDYFECVLPIMDDYADYLNVTASCGVGWADTCLMECEAMVTVACPLPSEDLASELVTACRRSRTRAMSDHTTSEKYLWTGNHTAQAKLHDGERVKRFASVKRLAAGKLWELKLWKTESDSLTGEFQQKDTISIKGFYREQDPARQDELQTVYQMLCDAIEGDTSRGGRVVLRQTEHDAVVGKIATLKDPFQAGELCKP